MLRSRRRPAAPDPASGTGSPTGTAGATGRSAAVNPAVPPYPPVGGALYREGLSDADWLRFAYNFVLEREPDEGAWTFYLDLLAKQEITRAEILDTMRTGVEYLFRIRPTELLLSLHRSRCLFVQSFPRARRILDLGGTHQSDRSGAMVTMGYPFAFEELVIVDLPHDDRHAIYTHSDAIDVHQSVLGPVRYEYHSMVDLSRYADGSFDLVYSGQTIEHVDPTECDTVLAEVMRVLRPGGWLYLDTPNGPVCRMHSADFINPDHKVEYSHAEFVAKLERAGFVVHEQKGLNWCSAAVRGQFTPQDAAWHVGVYGVPEECYLLAYGARKPG
jgi:SAM-dependent methyltransferase